MKIHYVAQLSLFFAAAVLAQPPSGPLSKPQSKSFPAVQKAAAPTAARELLQQAVEADLQGDAAKRDSLLNEAQKISPGWGPAHWLQGRIKVDGQYVSIDQSVGKMLANEDLAKFRDLRKDLAGSIDGQLKLARWCTRKRLFDQARVFYARILQNPQAPAAARNEAGRRLEMTLVNGQWLTKEERERREEIERRIRLAFKQWGRLFRRYQSRTPLTLATTREIMAIDDPSVIPVADAYVARAGNSMALALIKVVDRFPQFEATETLTHYAVLSPSSSVRRAAIKALQKRSLHDYVPLLLRGLVSPIQSRWQVRFDEDGDVLYEHSLFREGPDENVLLKADHRALLRQRRRSQVITNRRRIGGNDPRPLNLESVLGGAREERERVLQEAKAVAERRERDIERANDVIESQNQRIFAVLESVTAAKLPPEVGKWWDWWKSYNETYSERPTRFLYRPSRSVHTFDTIEVYRRHSCFVAGTLVWTERGLAAIETIEVGDRVLSQDVDTGELQWKVVQRTTAGGATSDVAVLEAGKERVNMTLGHVVWVSGQGWRIAKRIRVGERLHTLQGAMRFRLAEVQPAPKTVYNLVVEGFNTYFVGEAGLLVHDITNRRPTLAMVPGVVAEKHRSKSP